MFAMNKVLFQMIAENMKNKVFLIVKLFSIKNFPNESVQGLLSPLIISTKIYNRGAQLNSLNGPKKIFFACSSAKTDMLLHIKCCFYERNNQKQTRFWASGTIFKAFAGHIWPAGRMFYMPDLQSVSRFKNSVARLYF